MEWHPSEVKWASRWDTYLAMKDVQIHWFSIVNSIVVVMCLAGMAGLVMGIREYGIVWDRFVNSVRVAFFQVSSESLSCVLSDAILQITIRRKIWYVVVVTIFGPFLKGSF